MEIIKWEKNRKNMIIISENCEIHIPSEYYKIVDLGMNSFTMKDDSDDHVTFLWTKLVQSHEVKNEVDKNFTSNKTLKITCSLERIDKYYFKAFLNLKFVNLIIHQLEPEKEETVPEIEWIENKSPRKCPIAENCKIFLPTAFNNLNGKGHWGFEMTHYRSPVNFVKFFWQVPTFVINTVRSQNEGFLITPTPRYRTLKLGKRINKGIEINVSIHYDPSLPNIFTKIKREITFEPKKKIKA